MYSTLYLFLYCMSTHEILKKENFDYVRHAVGEKVLGENVSTRILLN